MENSGYSPNLLPPPALVVFSQAGGLSDALRMQRPYSSIQREGSKELSGGLCGGLGLRLMDGYPGGLPLVPDYQQRLFPLSAPYPQVPDLSQSPATLPSAKEDSDESPPTPPSDTSSPNDSATPFRRFTGWSHHNNLVSVPCYFSELLLNCKKKWSCEGSTCPVCSVTIRPGELDSHFIQELERLYKLTSSTRDRRHRPATASPTLDTRFQTYQRIRANRQGRLRIKNRKRKQDDVVCPVCSEEIPGTIDQLNQHVELCLRKSNNEEEEQVDVEGDEVYEEYEWAGQRRIRASSLLIGGYAGAGLISHSRGGEVDDEGDLVVDGDDSATFGPSQYSEADIVPISSQGKNFQTLRDALLSPDNCQQVVVKEEPANADKKGNESGGENDESSSENDKSTSSSLVVDALKARVKQLENDCKKANKCICLICMESYKKPLVSICCWHVHCEQCWLHTLGAKKLCPQCNMITSPSDLRRIYL